MEFHLPRCSFGTMSMIIDCRSGLEEFITAFLTMTKTTVNATGRFVREIMNRNETPRELSNKQDRALPIFFASFGDICAAIEMLPQIASCMVHTWVGVKPKSSLKKSGQNLKVMPLPMAVTKLLTSMMRATTQSRTGLCMASRGDSGAEV